MDRPIAPPVAVFRADGTCVLADPSVPAAIRHDAPPAVREALKRSLNGETVRSTVFFAGHAADAIFVPLASPNGAVAHVAMVLGAAAHEDVVERLAREADEATRMRDEFLSTASHELRTPLQAILGFSRMLRTHEHDDAKRDKALEVIERNARQQAQLIDDLLDVSRIITGRLQLAVGVVDLAELIQSAIEIARPAAEAKGIAVHTRVDGVTPSTMLGDPDRLRQVFWNLLSNAVKFTPRGGRVDVTLAATDGGLSIQVADTGRGIAPSSLPYLFERLRRVDGAKPTLTAGGLGLGLAIVRHLVEMHGGYVRAESGGENAGSTFTVLLPVRNSITPAAVIPSLRPQPPSVPPVSASRDALRGKKILAVDDEADTRELLEAIFVHKGAQVRTAASAAEAIEAFRTDRPDIVVSDVGLPGQDGYALVRQLRAIDAESSRPPTPMVALTAYARDQDRRQARTAGYDRHVPKPVDPEELVTVVARLIGSH